MRKVLYILGQLSDEDSEWLTISGRRQRLATGTTLIREGEPIDALYIVLDGQLSVTTNALGSQEIARLGAGEMIGEMSFIDARPPSATVRALAESAVFALDRARLNVHLDTDAPFAARFYRAVALFLSDRLRNTVGQLGYGEARESAPSSDGDELDLQLLDTVHLAGARFDRMLKRLEQE